MKTEREIQAEYDAVPVEATTDGQSRWPAMTYEQGVEAALGWVLGHVDEKPMEP